MNYKEFYFWLEGYLHGRLENKNIPITPIVEKMSNVKDENGFDLDKFRYLGDRPNPLIAPNYKPINDDELGTPPRIVM
jgi:hypothetical protein